MGLAETQTNSPSEFNTDAFQVMSELWLHFYDLDQAAQNCNREKIAVLILACKKDLHILEIAYNIK